MTAAIVFVLDVVFDMMNKYGISNVQNIVNEKFNSQEENTDNKENTNTDEQNPDNTSSTDETGTPVEGEEKNPEQ